MLKVVVTKAMRQSLGLALKRMMRHSSSKVELAIDCHTHMYTPKYMNILRKRNIIPRVIMVGDENRLLILPGEEKEATTSVGRKIGKEYYDVESKLRFMELHSIGSSIISLANPWFDFLEGAQAISVAQELNDELQSICETSRGKLHGFASLPVRNIAATLKEVERASRCSHIKGFILGTSGAGRGLDHSDFLPVLAAIEATGLPVFLHPHYGIGNEQFHDTGHALFLALGFPFETTVCVSRLIVSGALDKLPRLKLLVAHAGAALPSLIGRLDSCVFHDEAVANRLRKAPSEYLKDMYFDAISYGVPQLQNLVSLVGEDRIVFGTDNPFFPPPGNTHEDVSTQIWPSTVKVHQTIDSFPSSSSSSSSSSSLVAKIKYQNAKNIFNL